MKYYPKRVSQYINNVLLTQKHNAEKQNTVANFYLGLGSDTLWWSLTSSQETETEMAL